MAKARKTVTKTTPGDSPRCLKALENIRTSTDFAKAMGALAADTVAGRISPSVTGAACNAAGKLLRVIEMEHRYGAGASAKKSNTLKLT